MFARGGAREGPGVGLEMAFLATYLDVVGPRPLVVALVNEKARSGRVRGGGGAQDDLEPRAAAALASREPSICSGVRVYLYVYGRLRRVDLGTDLERRLFAGRRAREANDEALPLRFNFELVHRHARMSDDVEAVLEEDGDRHLPDLRAEEAGHVFDDAPEAELSKLAVAERALEEPRREEDVRSQVEPARESSSWGLRGLNRRVALHAIDATSARWRGGAGL